MLSPLSHKRADPNVIQLGQNEPQDCSHFTRLRPHDKHGAYLWIHLDRRVTCSSNDAGKMSGRPAAKVREPSTRTRCFRRCGKMTERCASAARSDLVSGPFSKRSN